MDVLMCHAPFAMLHHANPRTLGCYGSVNDQVHCEEKRKRSVDSSINIILILVKSCIYSLKVLFCSMFQI